MKSTTHILVLAALVALSGCYITQARQAGIKTMDDFEKIDFRNFKIGSSTKDDVLRIVGKPDVTIPKEQFEVWSYSFLKYWEKSINNYGPFTKQVGPTFSPDEFCALTFVFDVNGLLLKHDVHR